MAGRDSDEDGMREGVDFEWVQKDGRNYKTRRFFTKAEKEAKKNPKPQAKATPAKPTQKASKAPSSAPTTRPKPRPEAKTVAKPPAGGSGGRGDGNVESSRRAADAVSTPTRKVTAASSVTGRKPTGPAPKKTEYTYAEWQGMSREERKKAGLPLSNIGGSLAFKRFKTGITGKDYKVNTK